MNNPKRKEEMTARHSLDQIERGLDGVTPGPWREGIEGNQRIYGPDGCGVDSGLIASFVRRRDLSHIARCSPDAMREIAAYVRDLDERLAKAAEALEPFAKEADIYDPDEGDDLQGPWGIPRHFKIGDLRRARATLSQIRSEK